MTQFVYGKNVIAQLLEDGQRIHEIWTALQPNRDWAALEKEWSNAYSAPGGEVIG